MSQRRSDLHTFTNFFIYIFPPNLYWNRLDVWKCENSHWPPCYFLILPISESFDTVAFVRIHWCSCRVPQLQWKGYNCLHPKSLTPLLSFTINIKQFPLKLIQWQHKLWEKTWYFQHAKLCLGTMFMEKRGMKVDKNKNKNNGKTAT